MFSLERWIAARFRSDAEATNFSAHVGWSLALPLAGHALGCAVFAGAFWLTYSLLNEFVLHQAEDPRELRLNLVSRLLPCALVLFFLLAL